MLIGEFRHTLDAKKRIAIPASFRKEMGKKVVLTKWLDNCLSIYPLKSWEKVSSKLQSLSMGQSDTRSFNRFMLSGAVEAEIDSLGRILVPDFLKDFGGLKTKVVVIGVSDHAEIWDEEKWSAYTKATENKADALAEKLGEIGVF
jgi:MraZ protein